MKNQEETRIIAEALEEGSLTRDRFRTVQNQLVNYLEQSSFIVLDETDLHPVALLAHMSMLKEAQSDPGWPELREGLVFRIIPRTEFKYRKYLYLDKVENSNFLFIVVHDRSQEPQAVFCPPTLTLYCGDGREQQSFACCPANI